MKPTTISLCRMRQFLAALCIAASCIAPAMAQKAAHRSDSGKPAAESGQVILKDGRVVYTVADQMPSFNGDMVAFLTSNLKYPSQARKDKVEGRSVVRFIVNEQGKVTDAEIMKSSGNEQLDKESLRVVGLMQDWTAGKKDGQPVPVYFYLPVSYKLDK